MGSNQTTKKNKPLNLKALESQTFRILQSTCGLIALADLLKAMPESEIGSDSLANMANLLRIISEPLEALADDVHDAIQDAMPEDGAVVGEFQ